MTETTASGKGLHPPAINTLIGGDGASALVAPRYRIPTFANRIAVPVLPMAIGSHKTVQQADGELTDEMLVALAKEGDKKAFRGIVDRHSAVLARTIVGMIGDRGSVDDVLQDVFIQFHNSLANFRGDSSVRTYLSRIAVNKSLDLLRRRKRWHKRFLSRDETPILEVTNEPDHAEASDRKKLVWSAIDALPDAQRSVVVLRMIEGFSTEETAELLEIEYGTVLSRLSRGLGKLRTKLGPLFDDATLNSGSANG